MKRILGLDLGTNSIGWALVNEAGNEQETSSIIKLGVRVIQYDNFSKVDASGKVSESKNPTQDFAGGKSLTPNASRTQKRGARRNLQRYKMRRKNLIEILKFNGFIDSDTALTEIGKNTTHQTLSLRASASAKKIELEDLAKVFLTINKKRGYKSSRKAQNEEDGQAIDGMAVAKKLYDENLTPGEYVLTILKKDGKYIPDFYRSDLKEEFKKIWDTQKKIYPNILSSTLSDELQDKNKSQTWAICQKPFDIVGIKRTGTAQEKRLENYEWRVKALTEKLDLEHLAIVLQEINNNINKSSGYLGAISDRSKQLYLNRETVGQFLYKQLLKNPYTSLKNKVFYRQDYLDEFETIWSTQSKYHSELTEALKEEIRDVIIFYQRKLKSQKLLISFCQFESWEQEYIEQETGKSKSRRVGRRVIPKSSPLFQEFKTWQNLNHLVFTNPETKSRIEVKDLDAEIRQKLFEELNLRGDMTYKELLKILSEEMDIGKLSNWKSNFDKIEGNRTNAALFNVFQTISEREGYGIDWKKASAATIKEELKNTFPSIGISKNILDFKPLEDDFEKQAHYQLWHLLYATEEDDKISEEDRLIYGNSSVALKKKLQKKFGFKPEYATLLTNISFSQDYGNVSAKAIRNILPYLEDGDLYSESCARAGYNHSKSLNREDLKNRELKPKLEILKKNSLRNPMVEKILNQMVNVVNQIIDTYGKPDEIRIELARELKKSAKERAEMTKGITDGTRRNDEIRKLLTQKFGIPNPTKNDVIRYRLYQELESRGHKDLFTDTYIAPDKIFSKEIDIEHIIPKALLFDDSFSNKTLAFKKDNLKKANRTAYDFISQDYHLGLEAFVERIEAMHKDGKINRAKRNKLLMPLAKIPDGFIERDLRNSQYIARKAKEMLFEVVEDVVATTGSITDKLRNDWDLINVMKELNLPKYSALGLTEFEERLNKTTQKLKKHEVIKDWTKRNDHRHHAMDALAVAFTTRNHIQHINNLSARKDSTQDNHPLIKNIEANIKERNEKGKSVYKSPMPRFRESAKQHIESILISFKNKNKVVTQNINKTKTGKGQIKSKIQLTPRGQLHKETIYGKSKRPLEKPTKISKRFTLEEARLIINLKEREVVLNHLAQYNNNPQVAFDTKMLKNDSITHNGGLLKEVLCFEEIFTIRKDLNSDNFKNAKHIDKILDNTVKNALNARLKEYGNDYKKAFSDLDTHPIYLNKEKGIVIKRVRITGVSNAQSLHTAKNHLGESIFDENGQEIPVDFVSTGNNHHVAIYQDEDGELDDDVVPFYDAVIRKDQKLSIVKEKNQNGWPLLFSLKQNEMFIFPNENFDPLEIDLLDPSNQNLISPNLFRVQKISKVEYGNSAVRDYVFRHHLETEVNDVKELKDITWKPIKSLGHLDGIVKVRLNHLGNIVQTGEY
ncbi:CRISPR-associated endonuclease Csn1 [Gillisia sp. Hel_I_86]|uniref:type II CRISPR RNA-guided endonuclease Cas9 n=1 Tax=Gillisia sp. Hel_I_86 TaxID=1249981 RepID=UPI00119B4372|nr:type II CRISPR RNA-guided endonuclease Cas9 [Gillisia sp. Hel_I_86]TVZ28569.1 CRISPR-associated endonuclease Csn1 [Gillisia sp. Hel_I_86]